MEGLRLLDESSRDGGRKPSPNHQSPNRRRRPWKFRPPRELPLLPGLRRGKKRMTFFSMADSPSMMTAAVLTVSDSCARGEREDKSGPAVSELLTRLKFSVVSAEIVSDDSIHIQNCLIRLARSVHLVVTTGGTGIAARDVTPEATTAVCERLASTE